MAAINQVQHTATPTNAALSQRQVGDFTFDELGTKTFDEIGGKRFDDSYIIITNQAAHDA